MKTLKISVLALVSALSLTACDDDNGTGPDDLRRGQFEGEISGSMDVDVRGDAESGFAFNEQFHDLIVLTDLQRNIQVSIFESEDEFVEGRFQIDDETDPSSGIIAFVQDLDTGKFFNSVSGTLDIDDVTSNGIRGSARFTAESEDAPGVLVTVDVVFNTDFQGDISFSRSPSFSVGAKTAP